MWELCSYEYLDGDSKPCLIVARDCFHGPQFKKLQSGQMTLTNDIHATICVDVVYFTSRILLDVNFLGYGLDINDRQKEFLHDPQARV